ncbi:MAG: hypothetical protein JJT89_03695 [Nitriliruptoraceae bacterium]|nr:hypothetical protein [Nitriliruptoraceae bacterium]
MSATTASQVQAAAEALGGIAGRASRAAAVHETQGRAVTRAASETTIVWRSPVARQVADQLTGAATAGRSVPPSLQGAAGALQRLQDQGREIAGSLQRVEQRIAQHELRIRQLTWAAEPDVQQLQRERAALQQARREQHTLIGQWAQACNGATPTVTAAAETLRHAARRVEGCATRIGAGAGTTAAGSGGNSPLAPAVGALAMVFRSFNLLTGVQDALDTAFVLPALAGVVRDFETQVLGTRGPDRLRAFLRWQERVGRQMPISVAVGELARRGLVDAKYARRIADVPTAPNLSAFQRASSVLRLGGRFLAPLGLFEVRTILDSSASAGDRIAGAGSVFAGGVGAAALLGVAPELPGASAAGVASIGVLAYQGWKHRDAIGSFLSATWQRATGAAATAWDWASGAASSAWSSTTQAVGSAVSFAGQVASDTWNWTSSTASSVWDWTRGTASSAWDRTTDAAGRAWDWTADRARSAWNWGRDAVVDAWHWTAELAVTTLRNAIDVAGRVRDAVVGAARAIWDFGVHATTTALGWISTGARIVGEAVANQVIAPIVRLLDSQAYWRHHGEAILSREPQPGVITARDAGSLEQLFGAGAPEPGDVAAIAARFAALSPAEQRALAHAHPELVGSLDGAPPGLRSLANGLLVSRELTAIESQITRLERLGRFGLLGWAGAQQLEQLRERANTLRLIEVDLGLRPGTPSVPGLQLLVFDPANGRMAMANGDIATATHIEMMVPGTGATMDKMYGYLDDQRLLQEELADRTGGQHVSVVWLDYDNPAGSMGTGLLQATSPWPAIDGAPRLESFVDGMRATTTDVHLTVYGHSYGATLTSATLATTDLDVDVAVLVGSPGGMANHVDDYRSDARVVVATADFDLIRTVSGGVPTYRLGPDPASDSFGAEVVDLSGSPLSVWHPYYTYLEDEAVNGALADAVARAGSP